MKPDTSAKQNKQPAILDHLRHQISHGKLTPGDRLPTIRQMIAEYGVSTRTVQRAIERLGKEGFIRSEAGQGLFVADRPPSRTRFALVFPYRQQPDQFWSLYWKALIKASGDLEKQTQIDFPIHYDIEHSIGDSRDYRNLVDAVESDCVAGLIFANSPHSLKGTPVLDRKGLPRVAFMSHASIKGVNAVTLNTHAVLKRMLAELKQRGKRRVAVLLASVVHNHHHQFLERDDVLGIIREMGLSIEPHWIQATHPHTAHWAEAASLSMLHQGQKNRPEALLILDDNLTEHAQKGIMASGLRVPEQLMVITFCNFPCPPKTEIPMYHIGPDSRNILQHCVDVIESIRQGRKTEPLHFVPIFTQDEVKDFLSMTVRT